MLLGTFLVGVVVDVCRINDDLDSAEAKLDSLDLDTIRRVGIETAIEAVADDLDRAAERADESPFLGALAPLPLLGDQIGALRDLTGAVQILGAEGAVTGRAVGAALDRAGGPPRARIAALDLVLDEIDRIEELAADIDIGARGRLLGPVADAREQVEDALDELPDRLDPLRRDVVAVRNLLDGPSSYMVLVGNNAEMRSVAIPLTAAQAHIEGGELDLTNITPAGKRILITTADGGLNASPELRMLKAPYPHWYVGANIPSTSVVPNFPVTGPLYAGIAESAEGWESDGVIHIDVVALSALLEVVGPVEVDGVRYDAESASEQLLYRNYLEFRTRADNPERQDLQATIALEIFDALRERDVDVLELVAALQRAAGGRHFMVWSEDEQIQSMMESLGVSGRVTPFHTLVAFQNAGANKLDWFLRPEVTVETQPLVSGEWEVTVTGTLHNPELDRTSPYIDGTQLRGGTHRLLFSLHLPAAATAMEIDDAELTEYGFDGTSKVVGARFLVPRGATRTMTARFRLPADHDRLVVAPSARVAPVPWHHDGETYSDAQTFVIDFGDFPPTKREQRRKSVASIGAIVIVIGLALQFVTHRRQWLRRTPVVMSTRARAERVDRITTAALVVAGAGLAVASLLV